MMKFALIAAVSVFSIFTMGCGPSSYSCDYKIGEAKVCTEWTAGFNLSTVTAQCAGLSGTAIAACVKTGSTGNCKIVADGVTSVSYYFGTVEDGRAACATQTGSTYTAN